MKLKIGTKLGIGFGAILALMVVSALLAYLKAVDVRELQTQIASVGTPSIVVAKELQRELNQTGSKARQGVLAVGSRERSEAAQTMYDNQVQLIKKDLARLDELAPKWTLQENRDRLGSIKQQIPLLLEEFEEGMTVAKSGGKDAMSKGGAIIDEKAIQQNTIIKKALEELANSQEELLKQDQEVLRVDIQSMIWKIWGAAFFAVIIGLLLAVYLDRSISKAMGKSLEVAEAIAHGDLSGETIEIATRDELHDLALAINKMKDNLRKMIQAIAENAQNVANASEEFSAVSQQIGTNSEQTSAQANAVSAATEEVNRGLQTVASATEEMSASVKEIAKNATEAAKVANEAMKTAAETNTIVAKLGESSAEIGQVIKVITSIAQKTDLLALNATVEAARAGEVGAGFAVVANEVKELAKQTSTATEDIGRKIEAIQADAKSAVKAIASISQIIGQVNDISGTIATAVEEQSATTSEMARNISEAAKGSGEVAQNIHGVAQAAQSTSQGATDSQKAAKSLAEMSTRLQGLVQQFKITSNGHSRQLGA
jgi:methyl-accepting chemotaxis protein